MGVRSSSTLRLTEHTMTERSIVPIRTLCLYSITHVTSAFISFFSSSTKWSALCSSSNCRQITSFASVATMMYSSPIHPQVIVLPAGASHTAITRSSVVSKTLCIVICA